MPDPLKGAYQAFTDTGYDEVLLWSCIRISTRYAVEPTWSRAAEDLKLQSPERALSVSGMVMQFETGTRFDGGGRDGER